MAAIGCLSTPPRVTQTKVQTVIAFSRLLAGPSTACSHALVHM